MPAPRKTTSAPRKTTSAPKKTTTAPRKTAPAQPKKAASRKAAAKPKKFDLHARGGRVVSVYGPFASRVLVDMPAGLANELFAGRSLSGAARANVIEAVNRDIADIKLRDPKLAESALAATCATLAFELEHPFNSATSKSMCAKELRSTVDRLRELAPDEEEKSDALDDLARARAERLGRAAAS